MRIADGRRDSRPRRQRHARATTARREATRARRSKTAGFTPATSASSTTQGRLLIKGRKKEMIVTPEGLNVFPEDVERALRRSPASGAASSASRERRGARPRGARRSSPAPIVDAVVRGANARARGSPEDPRRARSGLAPSCRAPKARGSSSAASCSAGPPASARRRAGAAAARRVGRSHRRTLRRGPRRSTPDTTLDELGLSSLDRVELMMALEEAFQTTIDESAFAEAKTIADLRTARQRVGSGPPAPTGATAAARRAGRRSASVEPVASRLEPSLAVAGCGASACRPGSCRSARVFAWVKVEGSSISRPARSGRSSRRIIRATWTGR